MSKIVPKVLRWYTNVLQANSSIDDRSWTQGFKLFYEDYRPTEIKVRSSDAKTNSKNIN